MFQDDDFSGEHAKLEPYFETLSMATEPTSEVELLNEIREACTAIIEVTKRYEGKSWGTVKIILNEPLSPYEAFTLKYNNPTLDVSSGKIIDDTVKLFNPPKTPQTD